MNKLSKLSLAVIAALGLGLSGCGSSSSSSSGTIADDFAVLVSRGDVYGATVTDSATPAHPATMKIDLTTGKPTNTYTFDVPESEIKFPIKVNGGYIDVNDDGEITEGVDTKLNIEMKFAPSTDNPTTNNTATITPVTTYLADLPATEDKDAKLQELVDMVNENNDNNPDITVADLLKPANDTDFDAAVAINALYEELTKNGSSTELNFDLNDVNGSYNTIREHVGNNAPSVSIEEDTMSDLGIETLTADEVTTYTKNVDALVSSVNADALTSSLKSVSDLQGQTLYTMDLKADPATYTEMKLPENLGNTDTDLVTTSYELVNGEWQELPEGTVTVTAKLDSVKDDLTLVTNTGDKTVTNEIDSISLDGTALTSTLSVNDLTADGIQDLTTPDTDGTIYLDMTAEMKDPSTISVDANAGTN